MYTILPNGGSGGGVMGKKVGKNKTKPAKRRKK